MSTKPSGSTTENLVKSVYDIEFNRKQTIDEKSSTMMSVGSTIATLYGGFGLAVTTNLFNSNLTFNIPLLIMLIGVSLLVASIFFAAKAYLLREYHYALNYNKFIKKINPNNSIEFDSTEIEKYRDRSVDELNLLMIKIYTRCIALNYKINQNRAFDLTISQIIFFIGLLTIPLFILASIKF